MFFCLQLGAGVIFKQLKQRKWLSVSAMLALFILSIAVFTRFVDPWLVEVMRTRSFDLYNRMEPRQPGNSSPVVIADLDEKSLAAIGQWPWPRTKIAELLEALRGYGAAAVGFDIVFPEYDQNSAPLIAEKTLNLSKTVREELARLPDNETIMGAAMRNIPVVMGQAGTQNTTLLPHQTALYSSVKAVLGAKGVKNPQAVLENFIQRENALVFNVEELEENAAGLGFISVKEEEDGIIRRVPLIMKIANVTKPGLSLEMLRVGLRGNSIIAFVDQGGISRIRLQTQNLGNRDIPTDKEGRIWVYYAKPDMFNTPDNRGRMYISASDIMQNKVKKSRIQGRLVLIGTSAVGLLDIRATPIEPRLPGVEVHANILENIIEMNYISYPSWMALVEVLTMVLAGLALIFFIPLLGPLWTLCGLVIVLGSFTGASWYMFTQARLFMDVSYPGGVSIALFAVMTFANYVRDSAEKKQVRSAFSQYLSPDLVEQLAENPERLTLGGERRTMTLLFCDVRGFTTISESYKDDPQGLTILINRLLTPLTNDILHRKGTIDKYMGDCIMAFWNAPLPVKDHALQACYAAMEMFQSLKTLNQMRHEEAKAADKSFLPLNIGVGINTGECIVGNMGSEQRFDYSVLGDSVNLAARLEGQSKNYGVDIVLGPDTAASASKVLAVVELDKIAVKGKTEAVRIFTIVGDDSVRQSDDFKAFSALHEEMLNTFRAQKWNETEDILLQLKGQMEGMFDHFYALYDQRILEYRMNPPPADWDGSHVSTTK